MEKLEALLKQVKRLIAIFINLSPPPLAIQAQFDSYPAIIYISDYLLTCSFPSSVRKLISHP